MAKLTKAELAQVEKNMLEQTNARLEIELRKLRKTNTLLSEKIKKREIEDAVKKANDNADSEIQVFNRMLEEAKESTRKLNKKIEEKYKLKAGWGINPDTGEIVEEE